jgi:oligosaccharide repeat unit polymerase
MTVFEKPEVMRRQVTQLALGIALYAGLLLAKILAYVYGSPASPGWKTLLILNAVEFGAWAFWSIERHGARIGAALVLIPSICSLYSIASVGLLTAGFDVYPFPDFAVRDGMSIQSIAVTHFWAFTGVLISPGSTAQFGTRVATWINIIGVSRMGLSFFVLFGCVLAGIYVYNFHASGAADMLNARTGDRAEILDTLETGKLWLITAAFMAWLMVSAVLLLSKSARATVRLAHVCCWIGAVVSFFSAYGRLGNRREASIALIFICLLLLFKGRTRILAGLLTTALGLGMYIGVTRSMNPNRQISVDDASLYVTMFSEAVFPTYPLLDRISSHSDFFWGASYLRLPGMIMPTFGLWKKPLSLSQKFANEYANGKMGYAYTPTAEGYANFGVFGVVVAPLLLVFCESMLIRHAAATPTRLGACIPALIFLSLAFDINRGESSSLAIEVTMYSLLCWFYFTLCRFGTRNMH